MMITRVKLKPLEEKYFLIKRKEKGHILWRTKTYDGHYANPEGSILRLEEIAEIEEENKEYMENGGVVFVEQLPA